MEGGGPYIAQRQGCLARLLCCLWWLRTKPPQAGQCPSPSRGFWAALARAAGRPSVLAPPLAPGQRLAEATLTEACPQGVGEDVCGPGGPAPIFQLLPKPCQGSASLHSQQGPCAKPKRTHTALCWRTDSCQFIPHVAREPEASSRGWCFPVFTSLLKLFQRRHRLLPLPSHSLVGLVLQSRLQGE